MGYLEYTELVFGAPWFYTVALLIAFSLYIFMLRRQIDTVFDPLFLNMVFAAIGASTVIFLLFTGNIETNDFFQYSLSEFAYLICLTLLPLRLGRIACRDDLPRVESSPRRFQCIYLISSVVFVVSQSSIYMQRGLPISYESRLDYYSGGNGIGMYSRLIEISSYFCWYLLLHKYTYRWKIRYLPRAFDVFLVAYLVASSLLSGSKSELLIVVFLIFFFRALRSKSTSFPKRADQMLRRIQMVTLGAASCAALLVLGVTGAATDFMAAFSALVVRLAASGDVYFMAYPGSTLHDLGASHPLIALFGTTLWTFRLVSESALQPALGTQIFRAVTHSTLTLGPNPRHNIFGSVYFGYLGSLIYSSMLGLLVCFVRNFLVKYVRLGQLSELAYVFVTLKVINVNTDVDSFMKSLDNFIVVAPLILAAAYLMDVGTTLEIDAVHDAYPATSG
jgi:hypothetical protein